MEGKSFDSGLILPVEVEQSATDVVAESRAVISPKGYARRVTTSGKRALCETILGKEASKDFREWISDVFGGNVGPGSAIEMKLEAAQLGQGHKVKVAVYGADDEAEARFKAAMAKKFWPTPLEEEVANKFKRDNPGKPLPVIYMTWDYFHANQKEFARAQAHKEAMLRSGRQRQFVYR